MKELAPGLWRWTARHPEWHPGEFGREVAAYALRAGGETLLVDPIVGDPAMLDELVGSGGGRVTIFVTVPYHVRSAEALAARYDATIHGHPAAAKRFADARAFRAAEPGDELPGGARMLAIGRPRRQEQPVWLPSHRALAFGDAVVGTDGGVRMWGQGTVRESFMRERFAPTLKPLLDLDPERVLVTHGEPVLTGGRAALAAALEADSFRLRSG